MASHQEIGTEQELFFFNTMSPGSAFYWPDGALIFNKLQELLRREYRIRGYKEVMTPQIYNEELWKTSGHWDKYRENMYHLFEAKEEEEKAEAEKTDGEDKVAEDGDKVAEDGEEQKSCGRQHFSLKAMNCPGHCLMFKQKARSYAELPLKYADFGVLHRNEPTGSLRGLTRVRKFQQDDAHIFCEFDKIEREIIAFLDFLHSMYGRFGFKYELELSTRPEQYIGELEKWNLAESMLHEAMRRKGIDYNVSDGDGAFYGPKIDVHLTDSTGRKHQCGTVQLDFNLPERFDLKYATAESGKYERPVMIHRAIYGSFERFFAILCEHYQGKWPFWLSPRQVVILCLKPDVILYSRSLRNWLLSDTAYEVDIDEDHSQDLRARIKKAELARYHYIVVIGTREVKNQTVSVRMGGKLKNMTRAEFVEEMDSHNVV